MSSESTGVAASVSKNANNISKNITITVIEIIVAIIILIFGGITIFKVFKTNKQTGGNDMLIDDDDYYDNEYSDEL